MPKLASFRVKLVNFLSEKGRSSFLLRSLHFGTNRLRAATLEESKIRSACVTFCLSKVEGQKAL